MYEIKLLLVKMIGVVLDEILLSYLSFTHFDGQNYHWYISNFQIEKICSVSSMSHRLKIKTMIVNGCATSAVIFLELHLKHYYSSKHASNVGKSSTNI